MKSELLHFSSGLRSLESRIADIYEAIGGLNLKPPQIQLNNGEMAEWFKAAVLKTVVRSRVPRVRIPLSPHLF